MDNAFSVIFLTLLVKNRTNKKDYLNNTNPFKLKTAIMLYTMGGRHLQCVSSKIIQK